MNDLQSLSRTLSAPVQTPVSARQSATDDSAARADFLSLAQDQDRQTPADSGKPVPVAPPSADIKPPQKARVLRHSTPTTEPAPAAPPANAADAGAPDADPAADSDVSPKKVKTAAKTAAALPDLVPLIPSPTVPLPAPVAAAQGGLADGNAPTPVTLTTDAPVVVGDVAVAAQAAQAAASAPPALAGVARRIVAALRPGVAGTDIPAGRSMSIETGATAVSIEMGAATPVAPTTDAPARPQRLAEAEAKAPVATALAPTLDDGAAVRPASVAFGAAIRAALRADDPKETSEAPIAPTGDPTAALASLQSPVAITAAPTSPAGLDTTNDRWMQGMMDHIERVKDAANAGDTRIRMSPDALGDVGVSIRSQGDTIHVHFTAVSAETRALLTDAQPRLAEIAGERGLTLGQSSVDAGAGQQPRPQASASFSTGSPASAQVAEADSTTDHRIA